VNLPLSLSKDKIKIVLLEGIHPRAVRLFGEYDYNNIDIFKTTLSGNELRTAIQNAHMIGIRSRTKITSDVIKHTPKLIAIGCFCIGTDQVDIEFAASRGIPVFNAPHSNTRSVAELVMGITIMLFRNIFPKNFAAHHKKWQKSAMDSHEVRGKTIGIIGYGHIGSQVSILAEALGMRVFYFDIKTKLPLGNAMPVDSLDELLLRSDIVTLHVPEDQTTINMMNDEMISKMKEKSFLINASRGKVVVIDALVKALRSKKISGAAIDVFPGEPDSSKEKFESPLIGMDNVVLTPHIGGSTLEAQENIGVEVASKLVFFSDRGTTDGAVNFPEVNLKPTYNAHRILHIHENRPGLLHAINQIVAHHNINVLGQYLETKKLIGYVVIDIDSTFPRKQLKLLREELNRIDGTIRTRILY
jgi:D-3-phosphoglycerate dehydrogenase